MRILTWEKGLWESFWGYFSIEAKNCTSDLGSLDYFIVVARNHTRGLHLWMNPLWKHLLDEFTLKIEGNIYPLDPTIWISIISISIEDNASERRMECWDPPRSVIGARGPIKEKSNISMVVIQCNVD